MAEFNNDIKKCDMDGNASCFEVLLRKYRQKDQYVFLTYKYAKSLWYDEEEYETARRYFDYVIANGGNNKQLINYAKNDVQTLDNVIKKN